MSSNSVTGAIIGLGTETAKKKRVFFSCLDRRSRGVFYQAAFFSTLENIAASQPLLILAFALGTLITGDYRFETILQWGACLVVAGLLQAICAIRAHILAGSFSFQLGEQLRLRCGEHLRKIPLGVLESIDKGSRVESLLLDVSNIENAMLYIYGKLVACIIPTVLIGTGLLFLHFPLGLAVIATVPLAFAYLFLVRKTIDHRAVPMYQARKEATSRTIEYVKGIRTLRSLNLAGRSFGALDNSLRNLARLSIKMEAGVLPLIEIYSSVAMVGIVFVVFYGGITYEASGISLSLLIFYLVVSLKFYLPVVSIGGYFSLLRYLSQSVAGIHAILDIPEQKNGTICLPEGKLDLKFENVSFSYPVHLNEVEEKNCRHKKILNGVNFYIPAGRTLALTGPSGAGKSTMVNLITRFWDADNGRVIIGGCDVKTLSEGMPLSHMALVLQDVHFFNDTIANNLLMAKPDASEAEIWSALEAANCTELVAGLPDGLYTSIGDGGARLSGGEKRRLSIARAFLKDAPLLILDEATASLDPENEHKMQQAFERCSAGKTVVVIAHRLSTVYNADTILFIENGKIAEQGSFAELLAMRGRFAHFWMLQQRSSSWKINNSLAFKDSCPLSVATLISGRTLFRSKK